MVELVKSRSTFVWTKYNCTLKYTQEYTSEALAKEGTSLDRVHVEGMDQDQLEHHIEYDHSCHFSGQSTTKANNTFNDMTADIELDYDWSQLHFKGICAENAIEGDY